MTAKIIACLLTLGTNVGAGVVILFMMLIAMNGFSESDATWGLGAFILLAIIISALMGIASILLVHILQKKKYSSVVTAIIAVAVCSVVGIVAEVISGLICIGIADFVRRNY